MKKLICLLIIAFMLPPQSIAAEGAAIENVSAVINGSDIVITGTISSGEGKMTAVKVKNPQGKIIYVGDSPAQTGGTFKYIVPIMEKMSGDFIVEIGGYKVQETVKTKVNYTVSSEKEFLNYSINDTRGIINGTSINVTLDISNFTDLTASFAVSKNAYVKIGDTVQESGVTKNNFNSAVVYTVVAEDGSEKNFTVTVSKRKQSSGGGSGGGSGSSSGGAPAYSATVEVKPSGNNSSDNTETLVFSDLETSLWAQEYIYLLAEKGIINGSGGGLFEPERNITREEYVKILVSVLGLTPENGEAQMSDVDSGAWYNQYIYTAVKHGIVTGRENGTFGIGEEISRQDMAVMTYRAIGEALKTRREYKKFDDENDIEGYAKDAVKKLYEAEIINGMEANRFEPHENATRAQAAKIAGLLYNILN